ncbi:hypothetical protein C8C96_1236 [Acidovorax sp. 100]|nr:hypothetical protein C8C96_1236 [Acidovorax sp. 100]
MRGTGGNQHQGNAGFRHAHLPCKVWPCFGGMKLKKPLILANQGLLFGGWGSTERTPITRMNPGNYSFYSKLVAPRVAPKKLRQ